MLMSRIVSRRSFLTTTVGAAATTAIPWLFQATSQASVAPRLIEDPDGILDLPEGFSYRVVQQAGSLMTDGFEAPPAPDGMACFEDLGGNLILMRNHEIHKGRPVKKKLAFSRKRAGGVTRLVLDPNSAVLKSSNWVLTGTSRNCAGGATPYGWLSCEETEEDGHGFVFLCDPSATQIKAPDRLPSLGRFSHEAAAFDPKTGITYLTEDKKDSAIYRHVPTSITQPFANGALEALRVKDKPGFDLSSGPLKGESFPVEWVTIDEPEAEFFSTRDQAHERGAAFFSRGEGAFFFGRSAYFCSTNGGPVERGQLYKLDVAAGLKSDLLTLVAQAEAEDSLDRPDNVAVAPWGDVFVAEDGGKPNGVYQIDPKGKAHLVARNAIDGGDSEISGICFSPNGKWLFLNIQWAGLTLAVSGPFSSLAHQA